MTHLERHMRVVPRNVSLPPEVLNTRLKTVDDVHHLFCSFAESGNNPPFKFVYAVKVDTPLEFRPYDIVVVPREEQPPAHYVVSHNAVVKVVPGALSEVVMMSDWLREAKQFDALQKLRFFRNYIKLKILRRWLQSLSQFRFRDARTRVAKRLFLSKSTFARATMDLHKTIFDMQLLQEGGLGGRLFPPRTSDKESLKVQTEGVSIMTGAFPLRLIYYPDVRPMWGFSPEAFLDAQGAHLNRSVAYLGQLAERAVGIIMHVVENVAGSACVPDMLTMDELEQHIAVGSNVRGSIGALYKRERDTEREQRKREMKRQLVEYDLLQPWARLCDLMMMTHLFCNVRNTFDKFTQHIDLPRFGQQRELRIAFQVGVVFKGDEPLKFVPNQADLTALVHSFVTDTITRTGQVPRFIENRDLKAHLFRQPQPLPLPQLMQSDESFREIEARIDVIFTRDFADAQEKAKLYDPCRSWLHFVSVEWPEEHAKWGARVTEKAKEKMLSEADIKKYIQRVAKARGDLAKMSNKHCGVLSINVEPLVADLSSRLDGVLGDIKNSLFLLSQRRVHEVGKELENSIAILKPPPNELRDFAEWVDRCNTIEAGAASLLQEGNEVEALFNIAEDNGFDFPQHHKNKRDITVGSSKGGESLKAQFIDAVNHARETRRQQAEEIEAQLAIAVADTVGVLESTADELRHGEYKEAQHSSSLILSKLSGVGNTINSLRAKKETLNRYAQLLGANEPNWEALRIATEVYERKHDLWTTVARWEERRSYWNRTPVSQLDGEKMKEELLEMYKKAHSLNKEPDAVTERLLGAIAAEKHNLPVMVELCNPALKEEHWLKIFDGLGKRLTQPETRTLETLRMHKAYEESNVEMINAISSVATGEYSLLNQVNKIAMLWDKTEFILVKNRESDSMVVLGGLDDILMQLEDNQVQIQTCLASRFVSGIRELVEEWDTRLQVVSDVLAEWVNVQKSWMYLEFIFSSDDIKKQLPEESRMFAQVDKVFRTLMSRTLANNNVVMVCTEEGLLQNLQTSNENLDRIQKRLEDYLETKRVAFPRFYFLSNDELLSILSDVRNPTAVQPHLQKCFDNIKELDFETSTTIGAMKSTEGEVVAFSEKIRVAGNVENWLNDIEFMMRKTLKDLMGACVKAYPTSVRNEWYFEFPAQCIGCVDQIVWTDEMEQVWAQYGAGNANAGPEYLQRYKRQILDTVDLVKGQLSKLQRTCVCTLLVIDVHNRDVISNLIDIGCTTSVDFNWLKQLRYYWRADHEGGSGADAAKDCHIHHSAAHVMYGYEYLGNQLRLVITALTERAFLTCTSALHINQGAAPQGPAGTGKTESVKDLGKALARQVVVFNCSDGLNYKMMSQMFAGLAQAGAWACFDEFNRIEIEVLSVVAQQMLEITTAIANKQDNMMFDGHRIRLHRNFGVFITMNPGYAGRTELPDNLKALFRPICMMIPDYALIAEIMFFSEGFSDAKSLAQKMVRLYSLSSQQLSKQDHYDFGMRAVKSILVMAGGLKRAEPDSPEDMILIRAMRDSNVPKFLRDDTKLFLALINDLFPSVDIKEVINLRLQEELKASLVRSGWQPVPLFIEKVIQLYETMVVRHGVMLVGQTMTAKSANLRSLADALASLHKQGYSPEHEAHKRFYHQTLIHTLNPKSISMGEMYGDINRMTREWQDGVLSNIVRDLVKKTTEDRHWVTFDGPVDAIWIENMNTVLDDNKLLCLVNGERIKIPETISILFEVQDLRVASPATVSRCGMVYMEPYYLDGGWRPIAQSFSAKIQAEGRLGPAWRHERLLDLLDKFVPVTLEFLRRECSEYINTVDAQLVLNMLRLLHASIMNRHNNDDGDEVDSSTVDEKKIIPTRIAMDEHRIFDMLFAMCFVWGMGGNCADSSRERFSEFSRKQILPPLHQAFPDGGLVYDYFVHKGSMSWQPWRYKVPRFTYNRKVPYFQLLVPTSDTVILTHLLQTAVSVNLHVLLNGVTGTGKSSAVANFLGATLKSDDANSAFTSFSLTFSAQTTSQNLQETIESKLVRRRGDKELGPPVGKKMVIMVDDCNMPQLEVYGASPPIELLRQVISQGGAYDRKKLFFKEIIDTMFVACCGEPGGGKNELTPRLTSRFLCICATALSPVSMRTIFNGILRGFLGEGFLSAVAAIGDKCVDATIEVYDRIAAEMLPTPEKTHYTFNLRDVSKVVQGILQVIPAQLTTPTDLISLWSHEASRVFHDRLINDVDREWWWRCVAETLDKCFGRDPEEAAQLRNLLYGAWADRKSSDYKPITDQNMLQMMLREYQLDYNATKLKDVDLVLFDDAIAHLSRICRILRQPRGNALLVGVGGSGRHSLCHLAAHIGGMECREITIVRNYGVNDFREDIKSLLLECGVADKNVVFLLSDTQIIYNQFLEDTNNILNIGEVPGLMGAEEFDKIMQGTREAVREAGLPETRASMYQFFVQRCRDNLHVIMCMSPVGGQFRDRLRMFPSLVNCMTIDWFTPWPRDALLSVAQRQLHRLDVQSEQVKNGVCEMAVHMHVTVKDASDAMFGELHRRNFTTPTSYLSLLSLYMEMFEEQGRIVASNIRRYKSGLDKLDSTNSVIEELKKKIRDMQPVLERAAVEADLQKKELEEEQKEVTQVKQEVAEEERAARQLMDEAQVIRKECQDGLDEALPALHSAEKALQTLSKKDIDEIKVYSTPPTNVEKTMDAVLILLGDKEGWASAKSSLTKIDFLARLLEYKKDEIKPPVIRKLKRFADDKDFVPEVIEKTSGPCKSLCMWALAMYKYYHVAREVAPKRERLEQAERKVAHTKEELDIKQKKLNEVIRKIKQLEKDFQETVEKKANLESQITEARAKLGRADQLIGGLASERVRWEQSLQRLGEQRRRLVGTMVLAAGCVAYLGPFPSSYRAELVSNWTVHCKELGIPVQDDFTLDSLPDSYTKREWVLQGLPQDPFSVENGVILQYSKRWCLMVDPQGQANQYVRKKEAANKLRVLKLTDDNFMRTIESAIQVGHPVLLENVGEELDAALNPVLLKQAVKQGGRFVLKLGEKEVDYDPTFRLYITTKLPNPTFAPELQIKVTVLNFTVTRKGLEDQQLSDIVGFERLDLQEKSDECVVAIAQGKNEIKVLEDQILKMLADATGDILDNVELIETLSASKATATKITSDLEVVERTNAEIEVARERYRVLATRGSLIYSVIANLANVDPMYQYSLQFFKKLFVATLGKTEKKQSDAVEDRVSQLIPAVTWASYAVVCRGLFEKHKLLFSFLLTLEIFGHSSDITAAEKDFFLRGAAGRHIPENFSPKPSDTISDLAWLEFAALCELEAFKDLEIDFVRVSKDQWEVFLKDDDMHEKPAPGVGAGWSAWHRLLLIKVFRPEKLVFTISHVVGALLGKEYTRSPPFSLREAFSDSDCMSPLIFVLSTGTDPTVLFTNFAQEMGFGERKLMLSLGQDQGKRAAAMIEEGRKDGLWVYLQNCHVYVSWMATLERLVEQMKPDATHPDFRLWLTSNPSPSFPVPVLQSGMKLTREPPKGLKANLTDSFHSLDAAIWAEQDGLPKEREWKKLLFALAFFHALVQERRKFGALGWNIAYEWNAPDLAASVKTLRIAINDFAETPWTAIQFTVGVLNYGGRVTDFLDNRCLQAIVMQFFAPPLFDPDFRFDAVGRYAPPEPTTLEGVMEYVESLPQWEEPQLFGLHSNANITFQAKESRELLATIVDISAGGSASSGVSSPDEMVMGIANDCLARLPPLVDPRRAHESSFRIMPDGTMVSLGTVLSQEIDQFNRLLRVMGSTLAELDRAIKGEVVMSADMETMHAALLFNHVPGNWKKVGYLCLKPLASYFADLIDRISFIAKWCYTGAPRSFWLPGLFFPQGFITGVFQTHSRLHKMPIDAIKLRFHPQPQDDGEERAAPQSGVTVHGFYLEGAGWDATTQRLQESTPGTLYCPLPPIHFEPVPLSHEEPPNIYECPLYKASTRAGTLSTTGLSTNYVLSMQLPSAAGVAQDHWVSRGAAALCMLDY